MATMITDECINCGACEPECPNTAIYQGGVEWDAPDGSKHPALVNEFFYIVPEKCTECVGFYDHEACAAVCPVDCCIPNPEIPETDGVLIARARALHPDKSFTDDYPSRFKKAGEGDDLAAPPGEGNGAAAPAPTPAAARPAAAASVASAPAPVARFGKVEKKIEPLAQPAPRKGPFTGELPIGFDEAVELVSPNVQGGVGSKLLRAAVMLAQPLLGALPAATKSRLEAAIGDDRVFTSAGATGLNILLHVVGLPLVLVGLAIFVRGDSLYSEAVRPWFLAGAGLAVAEAIIRLREAVIQARPTSETVYRGSFYGPLLVPLVAPLLRSAASRRKVGDVAFEGYYQSGTAYDEKRERERRYGEIYTVEERPSGYLLRLELPRKIPPSGIKNELGLGDEMPDYQLDLSLSGGWLEIHGKVVDPRLRTVAATAPAFPPDFTTRVPLGERCAGFVHRYRDKVLEVVLIKLRAADQLPLAAHAA
jgi:ferredoxin